MFIIVLAISPCQSKYPRFWACGYRLSPWFILGCNWMIFLFLHGWNLNSRGSTQTSIFAFLFRLLQPLATCMHSLQVWKMAIGLQISEPWLREYQVHFSLFLILLRSFCVWNLSRSKFMNYHLSWEVKIERLYFVTGEWHWFDCLVFWWLFRFFHQELTLACRWVDVVATFWAGLEQPLMPVPSSNYAHILCLCWLFVLCWRAKCLPAKCTLVFLLCWRAEFVPVKCTLVFISGKNVH